MTKADIIITAVALLIMHSTLIIGGLFYPNTLAGAVARFVFSAN